MNKKLFTSILLIAALATPVATYAISVQWDRFQLGSIRPLNILDTVFGNIFTATSTTNHSTFPLASTTQITASGSIVDTPLGTPAGTFVAADPNGKLIATTTPTDRTASSTLLSDNNTFSGFNIFTKLLTLAAASSTDLSASNSLYGPFTGGLVSFDVNKKAYSVSTTSMNASITGNAGTATALAGNGTNCAAGFMALGVDASGNSEGCTYVFATTTPWAPPGFLIVGSNGQGYIVASSSLRLPNTALVNSTIVVNGTTLTLGDSADTITAASSTLLANNNTFSGLNTFTKMLTLAAASSTDFTASHSLYGPITNALVAADVNNKFYGISTTSMNASITGSAGSVANAHTVSGSITGTSFNGSAAVSDWTLNMANANSWTAKQTFGAASTTDLSTSNSLFLSQLTGFSLIGVDQNKKVVTVATSTLYGTCTAGQVIGWTNGILACVSTSTAAASGVTSIATTYPIAGGTITTTGTLSLNWGTTSPWTTGQSVFVNANGNLSSVATGTVSAGSSQITVTAGRSVLGGALSIDCATATGSQSGCLSSTDFGTFSAKESALTFGLPMLRTGNTINWVGLATTTQPASSNVLVSNGAAGVYGVATSSETCTSPINCTAFNHIGAGGAISLGTVDISSNTNLAATFPVILTNDTLSSGFSTTSDTGLTRNQVVYVSPLGTLITAATSSTGFYANGGTNGNVLGITNGVVGWIATSSSAAAAGTMIDFTPGSYASFPANSTSTQIRFTGSPFSIIASTTFFTQASSTMLTVSGLSIFAAASSTDLSASNSLYGPFTGGLVSFDVNKKAYSVSTTSMNASITGSAGSVANAHTVSGSITGTSFNGSAAVSDWTLNMANANSWTAKQTFGAASTTDLSTSNSLFLSQLTGFSLIGVDQNKKVVTVATSTLYGTGINGQVLGLVNGIPTWVSTTSSAAAGGSSFPGKWATSTTNTALIYPAGGLYAAIGTTTSHSTTALLTIASSTASLLRMIGDSQVNGWDFKVFPNGTFAIGTSSPITGATSTAHAMSITKEGFTDFYAPWNPLSQTIMRIHSNDNAQFEITRDGNNSTMLLKAQDSQDRFTFHSTTGSNDNPLYFDSDEAGTTRVTFTGAGRVGVNDTTPDYRIEGVGYTGNGYFGLTNTTDGDIFNVASNGNVGIGSSTPWGALSVVASSTQTAIAPAFIVASSSSETMFSVGATSSTNINLSQSGSISKMINGFRTYIGNAVASMYNLYINGSYSSSWVSRTCDMTPSGSASVLSSDTQDAICGWVSFEEGTDATLTKQQAITWNNDASLTETSVQLKITSGTVEDSAKLAYGRIFPLSIGTTTPKFEVTVNGPASGGGFSSTTELYIGYWSPSIAQSILPSEGCGVIATSTANNGDFFATCYTGTGTTTVDTGIASTTRVNFKFDFGKDRMVVWAKTSLYSAPSIVANISSNIPTASSGGGYPVVVFLRRAAGGSPGAPQINVGNATYGQFRIEDIYR